MLRTVAKNGSPGHWPPLNNVPVAASLCEAWR
jgi:hypothetical protein